MTGNRHELVESVGKFEKGQILEVSARFGEWHMYDVRLKPADNRMTGSIELTQEQLETVARPL